MAKDRKFAKRDKLTVKGHFKKQHGKAVEVLRTRIEDGSPSYKVRFLNSGLETWIGEEDVEFGKKGKKYKRPRK